MKTKITKTILLLLFSAPLWAAVVFIPDLTGGGSPTTDTFSRANETPLAGNWTKVSSETGNLNLSSNTVIPANANQDSAYYRSASPASFPNDGYTQVRVTTASTGSSGQGGGVIARASTSQRTYYTAIVDAGTSNNVELGKMVNGTYTTLGNATATYSAGAVLKLVYSGTSLTVIYNGSTVIGPATDSSIASGKPGVRYSSVASSTVLDDWEAQ